LLTQKIGVIMSEKYQISQAKISPCGKYRFYLQRSWDVTKKAVAFICLNPSTADETLDDPTVRRCVNYAKSWGYGTFYMLNLFAYRATDPKKMKSADRPIGNMNDFWIESITSECDMTICAWGNDGGHLNRSDRVCFLMNEFGVEPHALVVNVSGEPSHPLYLKKDLKPQIYRRNIDYGYREALQEIKEQE